MLIACGGSSKPPVVEPPAKPAPPPLAACEPAGPIKITASGTLACNELPLSITFPPGSQITRANDRALTMYSAKLERGVMLLIVEPRTDMPDREGIKRLLLGLIKGISADATTTDLIIPSLGAQIAVGLRFATSTGGDGIVRAYFHDHWLIAALVGASKVDAPTRPDTPLAKAFLDSITLRPIPTDLRAYKLAETELAIPASAWSTGRQPDQTGVRSEEIFVLPSRGLWLGIRELEPLDRCDFLKGATTDSELADRLKTIYSNVDQPLDHIERGKVGDLSIYAQTGAPPMTVGMEFVCSGKTVLQLTAAGDKPTGELRNQLDEVARSIGHPPTK